MNFDNIIMLSNKAKESQRRFDDEAIVFAKTNPHFFLGLEKMYNGLGTDISRVYTKYKDIAEVSLAEINAEYDDFQSIDFLHRDDLILGLVKRCPYPLNYVLGLKICQIDVKNSLIIYSKSYVSGIKESPIYYPLNFINCLMAYVKVSDRYRNGSDFVFVTRSGAPITRSRISYYKEKRKALNRARDCNNEKESN